MSPPTPAPATTLRYTFAVYVTLPLDADGTPEVSARDIAKGLAFVLRRLEGDTDYELMTTEYLDVDGGVVPTPLPQEESPA